MLFINEVKWTQPFTPYADIAFAVRVIFFVEV